MLFDTKVTSLAEDFLSQKLLKAGEVLWEGLQLFRSRFWRGMLNCVKL